MAATDLTLRRPQEEVRPALSRLQNGVYQRQRSFREARGHLFVVLLFGPHDGPLFAVQFRRRSNIRIGTPPDNSNSPNIEPFHEMEGKDDVEGSEPDDSGTSSLRAPEFDFGEFSLDDES